MPVAGIHIVRFGCPMTSGHIGKTLPPKSIYPYLLGSSSFVTEQPGDSSVRGDQAT